MQVRDLIEELRRFDPSAVVVIKLQATLQESPYTAGTTLATLKGGVDRLSLFGGKVAIECDEINSR